MRRLHVQRLDGAPFVPGRNVRGEGVEALLRYAPPGIYRISHGGEDEGPALLVSVDEAGEVSMLRVDAREGVHG